MPFHYFDNNATTHMSLKTQRAMIDWCNCGNPSAAYGTAKRTGAMLRELRHTILSLVGRPPLCELGRDSPDTPVAGSYKVLFTSGASESNALFFTSVIRAYRASRGGVPHIIISEVEHKSIQLLADDAERRGEARVSRVPPDSYGQIGVESVEEFICPDTALIAIMHANNETGSVNPVGAIGELAHRHNIPFYVDTAQTFGKLPLHLAGMNIDAIPVSFHKLHGPPGCGAIVIRSELVHGWGLEPIVPGTQNYGFRGGTENIPCLGAALAALSELDGGHLDQVAGRRAQLVSLLPSIAPLVSYTDWCHGSRPAAPLALVIITPADSLPGTLMIALVDTYWRPGTIPAVCNTKTKQAFERRNIILSVGSACNTSSPTASHVLESMGADDNIRSGALRVSLSKSTTRAEVELFIAAFRDIVARREYLR